MSTSILCMAVVLSAPGAASPQDSVYSLSRPFDAQSPVMRRIAASHTPLGAARDGRGIVFRGQTPGYDEQPPKTYVDPPGSVPGGGLSTPQQPGDPFLQGVPRQGFVPQQPYGLNGPQPYRLGQWVQRYDVGFLPEEGADRGLGGLEVFELDAEWEYATPIFYNWIFSFKQQFDLRTWEGPSGSPLAPTTALPGSAYRFGWDLALATPANFPVSAMVAFNPSLNSDFSRSLSSDAWQWDGRGMVFVRQNQYWTWVVGAGFWDRVNDRVVPYAGVIYTPDQFWEFRLLFPKGRISYFLGEPWGFNTWVYVRSEYHVEAYEIELETTGAREQVELADWRILFGFRWDNRIVSAFWEAGWVFGRDVDYRNGTPGFDLSSGFITRLGLRF
ncbi:MAG: hypothetical protein ACE5KM_05270 [Planctomycetaceae bacterium]